LHNRLFFFNHLKPTQTQFDKIKRKALLGVNPSAMSDTQDYSNFRTFNPQSHNHHMFQALPERQHHLAPQAPAFASGSLSDVVGGMDANGVERPTFRIHLLSTGILDSTNTYKSLDWQCLCESAEELEKVTAHVFEPATQWMSRRRNLGHR
jgi:hypothetical protein